MSTVQASTVVHPVTITMDTITPMAERQIEALGPDNRRRVIAALCRPVLARRCEQVTKLAKHRVGHFDVTGSVRVSYRRIGAQNCVIHVGVHKRFNDFAAHYTGTLIRQDRIIPVKESKIMKKNLAVASQNSADVPAADRSPSAPITPSATDPLRDALSAVCRDVLAGAVDGKLDRFLADLVEQHEQVSVLSRRLAAAEETLRSEFSRDLLLIHDRVRTEWNEVSNQNIALLRDEIAAGRTREIESLQAGIELLQNEIVAEANGRTREIESVQARLDQALSSLVVDRKQDVTSQSAAMGQAINAAFTDELNKVTAQLSKQLTAQSEVVTALRSRADEAAAEIAQLRTELSGRNKPSQLALLRSAIRRVAQSLARFRNNKLPSLATKN